MNYSKMKKAELVTEAKNLNQERERLKKDLDARKAAYSSLDAKYRSLLEKAESYRKSASEAHLSVLDERKRAAKAELAKTTAENSVNVQKKFIESFNTSFRLRLYHLFVDIPK